MGAFFEEILVGGIFQTGDLCGKEKAKSEEKNSISLDVLDAIFTLFFVVRYFIPSTRPALLGKISHFVAVRSGFAFPWIGKVLFPFR